jgi:hypothetical protein
VLRAFAAGLATLLLAAGLSCDSSGDERSGNAAPATTLADHLRALQRVADESGGNRSAGTAGDRGSVA